MSQGLSLHIGVNEVDPSHYVGVTRRLVSSERDAETMQQIAEACGFTPLPLLLGERATYTAVLAGINRAASELVGGDFFLLTFAGHGAQVPDVTGTEHDARNETWCLYDQQLIDHQLFAETRAFSPGVRVLIVADCCHSGLESDASFAGTTVPPSLTPRELSRAMADNVYRQHAPVYDSQVRLGNPARRRSAMTAAVLLLASCEEYELSYEGLRLGFFTDALVQAWDDGRFDGTYDEFLGRINELSPIFQTPNLRPVSEDDELMRMFRRSTPFIPGA